jgi:anti-sigma regulatory factor (Ser/Thr protein kinase)
MSDRDGAAGVRKERKNGAAMYRCRKGENEYAMVFSASFANVDRVCLHIDEFLRRHGIEPSFVIELGAREIMNNAITHGAGQDPLQIVRFRIRLRGKDLYLRSSDAGKGYQPAPPVQEEDTVLRESGYGLAILYSYFDSVSFNAAGNEITLELKNVIGL